MEAEMPGFEQSWTTAIASVEVYSYHLIDTLS